MVPNAVLIVAIQLLRRTLNKINMEHFKVREGLMLTHSILSGCTSILAFISLWFRQWSHEIWEQKEYALSCRMLYARRVANDLMWIFCSLMLILQVYMSTKFSAPAKDSQERFMLVYQA